MLKSLYIKNYALINELTVDFEKGLTILTGETGAGKSIIIGALSMILGERADSDVVRKGTEKAIVEAIFELTGVDKVKEILTANEIEANDELIIRREISVKSQNRCFINDSPTTIAILKHIGDRLVDLHGQHEHQSLLRPEMHIEMLDEYSDVRDVSVVYKQAFDTANAVRKEKEELLSRKQRLEEQRALYEFQLNEISAVNPEPNEEEQIEKEITLLENSERLTGETTAVYDQLYDGEHSVTDSIGEVEKHLHVLSRIDSSFEQAQKELESARSIIDELATFVREYRSKIEHNPERLEELRTRLGQIVLLKKKYGGTLESVLKQKKKAEAELALADNFSAEISRLDDALAKAKKECSTLAQKLTSQRQAGARKLDKEIVATLARLGIAKAVFETKISHNEITDDNAIVVVGGKRYSADSTGIDKVEFYLSTNAGESPKPLVKVASGGEVSRIMLSLKMNVVGKSNVPLLIFDEIDVGISGRVAQSVGQAMKELAKHHQVIAITHLPQIAGFADSHLMVTKKEDSARVETQCTKLTHEERIVEVARLMSGEEVTKAGLQSAKELIEFSKN